MHIADCSVKLQYLYHNVVSFTLNTLTSLQSSVLSHVRWSVYKFSNKKQCGRSTQYAPAPCDLLTLKMVCESRVTWATSVPVLVFLGLSVLDLGPMYTTDRKTDVRHHHRLVPPFRGRGIITGRETEAAANHERPTRTPNYSQLCNTMCSFCWQLRQRVLGTIRRWNWYRRLEDGRPTLQAMPGSPTSCSSSCPWHCRGGMRSHFKARSPPASSLQSVVSFS